jgi:hypothetical protein
MLKLYKVEIPHADNRPGSTPYVTSTANPTLPKCIKKVFHFA